MTLGRLPIGIKALKCLRVANEPPPSPGVSKRAQSLLRCIDLNFVHPGVESCKGGERERPLNMVTWKALFGL